MVHAVLGCRNEPVPQWHREMEGVQTQQAAVSRLKAPVKLENGSASPVAAQAAKASLLV